MYALRTSETKRQWPGRLKIFLDYVCPGKYTLREKAMSEVTAIASEFGNSAKIIVPRSWLGKRVIAFLHSEYITISGAKKR